jgi:hypothetical protein
MPGTETERGWPLEVALGAVLGVINLVFAVIVATFLYAVAPDALSAGRWFLPLLLAAEFAGGVALRPTNRLWSRLLFWATLVSVGLIAVVAVVVLAVGVPAPRLL